MCAARTPRKQADAIQKKQNIPVQITDMSMFDNAFVYMKERFAEEMRRIDEQMNKFSKDLMHFYGQNTSIQTGTGVSKGHNTASTWDALTSSPLVQGQGADKTLKLQFDVSQFDPTEVKVKLLNNILVVSATHEENTKGTMVYREYNREFMLPPDTDPESVVSSLSRDGVLTVEAPLPQPTAKQLTMK